jgi:hypothetical protein
LAACALAAAVPCAPLAALFVGLAASFAALAAAVSFVAAPSVEAVGSVLNTGDPMETTYALHERLATICASLGHNHFD